MNFIFDNFNEHVCLFNLFLNIYWYQQLPSLSDQNPEGADPLHNCHTDQRPFITEVTGKLSTSHHNLCFINVGMGINTYD